MIKVKGVREERVIGRKKGEDKEMKRNEGRQEHKTEAKFKKHLRRCSHSACLMLFVPLGVTCAVL